MRRRQCLRDSDCKSTDIANWSLHWFGRCIEKENNVKSYFSMLSGILCFVAPLYEIASGHKYRAGSYRSASNSTRDTRSECEIARMKRLDAIRRDTTRYDSTPCDPARKRVSSVVAARSKAPGISYTRSIHARNSEHVNLGKSCEWPSTLLPSAPYPSSSFSIFILFSCLFAGLFLDVSELCKRAYSWLDGRRL